MVPHTKQSFTSKATSHIKPKPVTHESQKKQFSRIVSVEELKLGPIVSTACRGNNDNAAGINSRCGADIVLIVNRSFLPQPSDRDSLITRRWSERSLVCVASRRVTHSGDILFTAAINNKRFHKTPTASVCRPDVSAAAAAFAISRPYVI
ncbi:hypothetical protein Zmor_024916 [Zophobas morio]|uniref:Uncharacterized protein n=1 Tax=Zophobas morio TaxID=2755281 RepID=A0AA38HSV2_9CUCU|nr:hypothetical protein Zmor_024916 [Zophobas morio]